MTYRAKCPSCGHKFGRSWFFRGVPEYRHTCPACHSRIKSNSWWEWIGSAIIGLPVVCALGFWHFWRFSGWAVLLVTAVMLAVGVALYPYVTKFDLSSPAQVSYDCFEELITQLRAEGHARTADILHHRLHVVAWTSGSELLEELGTQILRFQKSTPSVSAEIQQLLSRSMEMVRRFVPDIR